MKTVPFSLYDAFSQTVFGGSQGAIVLQAENLDANTRLQIARELGFPATCFVTAYDNKSITARFQSTEREYPMCGHGTICLMTHMLEIGALAWNGADFLEVDLKLPTSNARVEIYRRNDRGAVVMLDIKPPDFRSENLNFEHLAGLLGVKVDCFDTGLPIETALGDFKHLVVPIAGLKAIRDIKPDFAGLIEFCRSNDLETIACFSSEVEIFEYDIHVRDFCPYVGVPESAAAGTTNAALASYLVRHHQVKQTPAGKITIRAEQGLEINRPSTIVSEVTLVDGNISRLQVGGMAIKVIDGELSLPG